jgi:HSP20 family protein
MTLMRFDPFRELDRVAGLALSAATRGVHSMPMEALRRGDEFLVRLDLPGVPRDNIDLTVESNVVSVRVRREPDRQEGDEVIVDERLYGEFTRQLFLGDNLDPDGMSADTHDGVLTLTIPVREAAKPRRVQLGAPGTADGGTGTPAGSAAGTPAGSAAGSAAGSPAPTESGGASATGRSTSD